MQKDWIDFERRKQCQTIKLLILTAVIFKTGFLVTGSMVLCAAAGTAKAAAVSRMSDRVLSDPPVSEGQRILGSGKAALKVSEVGFGCMGLNYHRGEHPEKKN